MTTPWQPPNHFVYSRLSIHFCSFRSLGLRLSTAKFPLRLPYFAALETLPCHIPTLDEIERPKNVLHDAAGRKGAGVGQYASEIWTPSWRCWGREHAICIPPWPNALPHTRRSSGNLRVVIHMHDVQHGFRKMSGLSVTSSPIGCEIVSILRFNGSTWRSGNICNFCSRWFRWSKVGDVDTRHSKLPLFIRLRGSILPKMLLPLIFVGLWATAITCISKFVWPLGLDSYHSLQCSWQKGTAHGPRLCRGSITFLPVIYCVRAVRRGKKVVPFCWFHWK